MPPHENSPTWMTNDLSTRRVGYLTVALFVLIVGGWSACAPLQSAALAIGVVQVEGKRKPVQHLEGGIVSQILVSNGDTVHLGQPLILLDAARDRAEMEILQGRIFNELGSADRLVAERDDNDEVVFSYELISAAESDQRANNAISSQRSLFAVRLADRLGEESVVESQQKGLMAIAESKRSVLLSLEEEIEDLTLLLDDGYVDKRRLRELERSKSTTLGELADVEVAIEEARLKILQLRKRFKTKVVEELRETDERLHEARQQYAASSDRVDRATIRAPIDGIVMSVKPNAIGAVIGSGEALLEVVPADENLIVEARISPMDIERIRVGQSAEVRFSVFKDAFLVTGELTKVSADRIIDEQSDEPYYSAEVRLLKEDLRLLEGKQLIPGMPAEVLIKTGQRTMLGYITSPLNRLFSRALIED